MTELEVITIDLSELEAMRLCELDGLDQEEAGHQMGVSRGTIQHRVVVSFCRSARQEFGDLSRYISGRIP